MKRNYSKSKIILVVNGYGKILFFDWSEIEAHRACCIWMILTLYPRGKDSVSLRWLQLAAHNHRNHLPHSIIHHCGARMQRQQWKENPMEDLCWTVATSAQSRKQSVENASRVTSQKVSENWNLSKFHGNFHGIGCWDKRFGLSWKKTQTVFFSGTFVQQILTSKDGRPMLQALPDFLRKGLNCEVGNLQEKGLND